MRYVAKIHVVDLMDHVVLSGYCLDSDPLSDPEHEVREFTHQFVGMGFSEPQEWLSYALTRGGVLMRTTPHRVV